MNNTFFGCFSLQFLDLSNFNTKNVKYMAGTFSSCISLKSLNLSSFNTENVEIMYALV